MITFEDATTRAIAQGLVSITYDTRKKSVAFVYDAGAPFMVNECISWVSKDAREVTIFDGERLAHRYRKTGKSDWTDILVSA
jgi:Leu/Phe-tRNA-protein transferase